ncbi:MAG TPA: NRDE family protein [Alphaproteobacteria bacterium]|nr:NRDE family protein [Alphaproteobacteria bacterium]
MVILRRPGQLWPLLIAANRDENGNRPWDPPARHWSDRPEVVAGHDRLAGGSWLGINDHGVVAGILNRRGSLGPESGKRSRGELVLEALDHADAREAVRAIAALDGTAYRPFNLMIADNRDAAWIRHSGSTKVEVLPVPIGLSMLTAGDLNDDTSPRVRRYLPRFKAAAEPDPGSGDWSAWESLLASTEHDPADGPGAAMTIVTDGPFGTVSSALIALPQPGTDRKPVWRFAAGRPGQAPYQDVALGH